MCSIKKRCAAVLLVCLLVVLHFMPVMAAIDVEKYPPVNNNLTPWDVLTEVPEGIESVMGCDGFDKVIACQYHYATMDVYSSGGCRLVLRGFPDAGAYPIIGINFESGSIYRLYNNSLVTIAHNDAGRMMCSTLIVELDSNGSVTSSEFKEYICNSSGLGSGYILEPWTNIWVFDSLASMNTYVSSGDTSGVISGPVVVQEVLAPQDWTLDIYNYRGSGDYDGLIIEFPLIKHRDISLILDSSVRVDFHDSMGNTYQVNSGIHGGSDNLVDWTNLQYDGSSCCRLYIRLDKIAKGYGVGNSKLEGKILTFDKVTFISSYRWPNGSSFLLNQSYPNDVFLSANRNIDLATGKGFGTVNYKAGDIDYVSESYYTEELDFSAVINKAPVFQGENFDIEEAVPGIHDSIYESGDIISFISSGFGLFGDSGLFSMLGNTFSFIPSPIVAVISTGSALVFIAIVYKLVRG